MQKHNWLKFYLYSSFLIFIEGYCSSGRPVEASVAAKSLHEKLEGGL